MSVVFRCGCVAALLLAGWALPLSAADLDYRVVDPDLTVRLLDTSPDDSFLSVRCDTAGRLFVGGRRTLFAYDVGPDGKYLPRQLLFTFPDHTWVNDIEIRGDDLYVSTVSAIYRLPGARLKRSGVTVERLLWGVPNGHVHQCFHALAWGPDGDLSISMGDPLWYYGDFNRPDHWGHWSLWFRPDAEHPAVKDGWARLPYNGVGAVFRIRPDGTNLRSVARGLRNPCGLCYDREWNLFSNDNDHEGLPALYAPGRLLHVTEGAYFSWPRGWLLSKTPDRADLLPTVNEKMGRAVPVLQTYYADGYLGPKYENNLLVTRWERRAVARFPLERQGASFKAEEEVLLEGRDQARPVGVCVGRDGRVFVTMCYMAQNEGSPTYRSDVAVITRKDDPESLPFAGYEAPTAAADKLWSELNSPRWGRRSAAHQELLRRGAPPPDSVLRDVAERARTGTWGRRPSDVHLLHLLRLRPGGGVDPVALSAYESRDVGANEQAARAFGPAPAEWFSDREPRRQLAALEALASSTADRQLDPAYAASLLTSPDPMVRSLAAFTLAPDVKQPQLSAWAQDSRQALRLGATLLAGFRLTVPALDWQPPPEAPLQPQRDEKANIIEYADQPAPIDLRQWSRVGNYTVADLWKSLPHTPEQEMLFEFLVARLDDADDKVRLQAAHFLSVLNDPRSEPLIAKATSDVQDRRLNLAGLVPVKSVWMLGPVADAAGLATRHPIESSAIDLAGTYSIAGKSHAWRLTPATSPDRPLFDFQKLFGRSPNSSVYSYFRAECATPQRAQLALGSEDGVQVWINGKLAHAQDVVRPNIQLDDIVTLELAPGSNDILVRVHMQAGVGGQYLHFRHLGGVQITLPDKPDGLSLAERLKSAPAGSQPLDPQFLQTDWTQAVAAGDPARGKKLFAGETLGCAKCHAATPTAASGGGPSLADAGKRFTTAYLVESVLAPSRIISPVFKATTVATLDGKVVTGLVINETAEKVELLLPTTQKQTILKAQIEERKPADVSAMPAGLVKTPAELRDVLAYLLSNPQE